MIYSYEHGVRAVALSSENASQWHSSTELFQKEFPKGLDGLLTNWSIWPHSRCRVHQQDAGCCCLNGGRSEWPARLPPDRSAVIRPASGGANHLRPALAALVPPMAHRTPHADLTSACGAIHPWCGRNDVPRTCGDSSEKSGIFGRLRQSKTPFRRCCKGRKERQAVDSKGIGAPFPVR